MPKNSSTVSFNRRFYSKCDNGKEICPLTQQLEGRENRKLGFISQFFYSCIAVFILGNNIEEGQVFFQSLLLFCAPLFLEYLSYKSKEKINNNIYIVQKVIFGLGTFIGAVGSLSNIISVNIIENTRFILISKDFFILPNSEFKIIWILYPLLIGSLLTVTNAFSLSSLIEKNAANQDLAA